MIKIKSIPVLIIFYLILILIIFILSCRKEAQQAPKKELEEIVGVEINVKKIENITGVEFRILKTQSIGYIPLHKFYWCCLREKINPHKLEELANAVIKEAIASELKTYHSFTIQFFLEEKLKDTLEKSECCARASFLPEGSWLKVGRIPINDYKNYKLTLTFLSEESFT